MKTIKEILQLSIDYLKKKEIKEPRRQAEDLLTDFLGIKRLDLYLNIEKPLNTNEIETFRSLLKRRSQGEPLQYIHGKVDFYHCTFSVNPSVLIPRQETEILVDKFVKLLEKKDLKDKILWDICCGSGCIGISLKKRFPELTVILSDISVQALELAQQNAKLNHVNVQFVQGDLLTPFVNKKAHFVICNPPYISEDAYQMLDREVHDYEPMKALVGGKTGLEFYERLSRDLPIYLNTPSLVAFEIGFDQENQVKSLFNQPYWKHSWIEKDYAGHSRFFFLENE